jgi:hypothetical protein
MLDDLGLLIIRLLAGLLIAGYGVWYGCLVRHNRLATGAVSGGGGQPQLGSRGHGGSLLN